MKPETLSMITYNYASNEIILESDAGVTKSISCDTSEEMTRLSDLSMQMAEGFDVRQKTVGVVV